MQSDIHLHIIIDNVRSAYNVGSFFRTADGAGGTKLYLCGFTPFPPNPKLEKTALGSISSVPWAHYRTTLDAIEDVHRQRIPVYAVEYTQNSIDYRSIHYHFPAAFVLGNEVHGVSDFVLDRADQIIHVPMRGMKSSLNVATVAGIIVYEASRDIV